MLKEVKALMKLGGTLELDNNSLWVHYSIQIKQNLMSSCYYNNININNINY